MLFCAYGVAAGRFDERDDCRNQFVRVGIDGKPPMQGDYEVGQ